MLECSLTKLWHTVCKEKNRVQNEGDEPQDGKLGFVWLESVKPSDYLQ